MSLHFFLEINSSSTIVWIRIALRRLCSRLVSITSSHFILVVSMMAIIRRRRWWSAALHHVRIIKVRPTVRVVSWLHSRVHLHLHWVRMTASSIHRHAVVVAAAGRWWTTVWHSVSSVWSSIVWRLSWLSSIIGLVRGARVACSILWSWLFRCNY